MLDKYYFGDGKLYAVRISDAMNISKKLGDDYSIVVKKRYINGSAHQNVCTLLENGQQIRTFDNPDDQWVLFNVEDDSLYGFVNSTEEMVTFDHERFSCGRIVSKFIFCTGKVAAFRADNLVNVSKALDPKYDITKRTTYSSGKVVRERIGISLNFSESRTFESLEGTWLAIDLKKNLLLCVFESLEEVLEADRGIALGDYEKF